MQVCSYSSDDNKLNPVVNQNFYYIPKLCH